MKLWYKVDQRGGGGVIYITSLGVIPDRKNPWCEMRQNVIHGILGSPCVYIGETGPGKPPEDGEINEMTLPSRHRICNSGPGGLRPSTLPRGPHNYCIITTDRRRNILFLWNLKAGVGCKPAISDSPSRQHMLLHRFQAKLDMVATNVIAEIHKTLCIPRDRLVTLRTDKHGYFSERRGS